MTQIQAIRQFASYVANTKAVIARTREEWSITLDYPYPYLTLPKDLMENSESDKAFRKDFVARCPMGRGFANVTLSVLHEIGHFFNKEAFDAQDMDEYKNVTEYEEYFALPCEKVATDWAINWLQNKEHRKVAKAFEKSFFIGRN